MKLIPINKDSQILLSNFAKIAEKCFKTGICILIDTNNMISHKQFGVKSNASTDEIYN